MTIIPGASGIGKNEALYDYPKIIGAHPELLEEDLLNSRQEPWIGIPANVQPEGSICEPGMMWWIYSIALKDDDWVRKGSKGSNDNNVSPTIIPDEDWSRVGR